MESTHAAGAHHVKVPAGTVVVGVDGSRSADQALDWAAEEASLEHRPLTLVHALGPLGTSGTAWLDQAGVNQRDILDAMRADGQSLLDTARVRVARKAPDVEVHEVLRLVDPREALLDLSHEAAALVLGSRGRGPVRSLVLGSVSVGVSRHASCPVVILRPHNQGVVRRGVLVGADGTERSRASLEFAYRQASLRRLPLTVMHCFWDAQGATSGAHTIPDSAEGYDDQRLLLAESVSGMTEKFPDVHVHTELARGLADDCLVRASARMELVVVGFHHSGTVSGLVYGSVASTVLEHASCVVAVVPEPERAREPA
ncbi:universal stress protein [Nocardioides ungokensis]|uniref:universal stress protein n=1 Tax=Nocardioides ungokensis TaxID=1643322 RepID=UPI0015DF717A|nr:universal stress protein [Nocardioides ungokensis]